MSRSLKRMPIVVALVLVLATTVVTGCAMTPEVSNPVSGNVFTLSGDSYDPHHKYLSDQFLDAICDKALAYAKNTTITTLVVKNWEHYGDEVLNRLVPMAATVTELHLENSSFGYEGDTEPVGQFTHASIVAFDGGLFDGLDVQVGRFSAMPWVRDLTIPLDPTYGGLKGMVSDVGRVFPSIERLTTGSGLSSDVMSLLTSLPGLTGFTFDVAQSVNSTTYFDHYSGFLRFGDQLAALTNLKEINGTPAASFSLAADVMASPTMKAEDKTRILGVISLGQFMTKTATFTDVPYTDAPPSVSGTVCLIDSLNLLIMSDVYDTADADYRQQLEDVFPSSRFAPWTDADFAVVMSTTQSLDGYWYYEGNDPYKGAPAYSYSSSMIVIDMKNGVRYLQPIAVADQDALSFVTGAAGIYQ